VSPINFKYCPVNFGKISRRGERDAVVEREHCKYRLVHETRNAENIFESTAEIDGVL
jgi:hypothetical protein